MFKNVKRNSLAVPAPTDVLKQFRCVAVTFKLVLLMWWLYLVIEVPREKERAAGWEGGGNIDGIKNGKERKYQRTDSISSS